MRFSSDCLFCRDTFLEPFPKPSVFNIASCILTPFEQGFSFPKGSDKVIAASIQTLFRGCGPTTISGFIIAIIVNTVNGVFYRGAQAHIFQKVLEVFPSLAHRNPTSAISGIEPSCRIGTSSEHSCPRSVSSTSCHAMNEITLDKIVPMEATATFGVSPLQTISTNNSFYSAGTTAKPLTFPFMRSGISDDCPTAKSAANQIIQMFRNWGIITHVDSLLSRFSAMHLGVSAPQVQFHIPIIPPYRGNDRRYELAPWGKFSELFEKA